MIRMSKQTDYGIVIMTRFSSEPDPPIRAARDLALQLGLPLPTVSKVLKVLARAGLLLSHRGVKGGYSLPRPPEEITLAEIISVLEGPIAMTICIEDAPGDCERESVCTIRNNWRLINEKLREALGAVRLSDMAAPLSRSTQTFVRINPARAEGRSPLAEHECPVNG